MTAKPVLYDYWRSTASYRVRIALNMARIAYETVPVNLLGAEHKTTEHMSRNPQGLVPALDIDGLMLTQSLAIIEYLDEKYAGGIFLPGDAAGRARGRALAQAIAMEIHPVCNLSVAAHVAKITGGGDAVKKNWMVKFITQGLTAFEAMLDHPATGSFCHGNRPTMADICLIPQLYNANRWGVDLTDMPRVRAIANACERLPAFQKAFPQQPA